LGFVVKKENILGEDKSFVEVERDKIYGADIQDYKSDNLNDVRIIMQ